MNQSETFYNLGVSLNCAKGQAIRYNLLLPFGRARGDNKRISTAILHATAKR